MQETKKAFRNLFKKKDLESAVAALSNLKGVGPAMASGKHRGGWYQAKLNNRQDAFEGDLNQFKFMFFYIFLEREILPPVDELGAHKYPASGPNWVKESF